MRLVDVTREASPDTPGCVRTIGVIARDSGDELRIWVDVPETFANDVSVSGNPWLVAMLPIAASTGEDIQLAIPVDALLLENLRGVLAIWREWYPELHEIGIDCPAANYEETKATRTAAFFSGGIDSYFTIARRMPGNTFGLPVVGEIDDLLTVWGFDVGVYDAAEFLPMAKILSSAAQRVGVNHAIVRTNLRDSIAVFKRSWGPLTFGVGLAFIGLILEQRFREVVLGSSYPFGSLVPWGSHPMLDPLFSTSSLRIVHDGASFTRIGKTNVVAKLPEVAMALHVCQASGVENCSRCEKCYRTMVALDILGQRERFQNSFDWSGYRIAAIRTIYMGVGQEQIFYKEMITAARGLGRNDIVDALSYASIRSSLLAPLLAGANWIMKIPLIWGFGQFVRRLILRNSISPCYIDHTASKAPAT